MILFPSIQGHELFGWMADHEEPWRVLDKSQIRNLSSILNEFIIRIGESNFSKYNADIGGPVFIHESAQVGPYVKIEGPVIVESGAEIRHNAYLRPGTYIGERCVVGHSSEIKNTLMMPGSKAPHFNYVGDSIIGCNVNLGAGTKISNVRLDKRTIPIQLANGKRLDSGMKKFGALVGDDSEIGCNVVTNPGSILPPGSAVPPNVTVTGYWN